jgi:periplasmic divalent cation tolerance protein
MSSVAAGRPIAACLCQITVGSSEEARRIGRALVEERLAAAVNIVDGVSSLYWWQGRLEQAEETVTLLKTRSDLVPALAERVRQLHSYECPCVVALPIVGGNADYLTWIESETRAPDTPADSPPTPSPGITGG